MPVPDFATLIRVTLAGAALGQCKVTLSLSQRSVVFFKRAAARHRRVPYQRMIRALVDAYAEKREGVGRFRALA